MKSIFLKCLVMILSISFAYTGFALYKEKEEKVAILAYGSLIKHPEPLEIESPFTKGGPPLPIDYSRISGLVNPDNDKDCPLIDGINNPDKYKNIRLSLIVLPGSKINEDTKRSMTHYTESGKNNLEEAREDLKAREKTRNIEAIPYIKREYDKEGKEIFIMSERAKKLSDIDKTSIITWLCDFGFDAVIWTNLLNNFDNEEKIDGQILNQMSIKNVNNNKINMKTGGITEILECDGVWNKKNIVQFYEWLDISRNQCSFNKACEYLVETPDKIFANSKFADVLEKYRVHPRNLQK